MKKNLLLVMAVCLFAACSGGGSIGGPKNIFGDLPDKLEEVAEELKKDAEKMQDKFGDKNDPEDFAEALAYLGQLGKKLEEKTAECRENLVGTKLPFEVEDSLPYTISDVTVTKVDFEKLDEAVMTAGFTLRFKEDYDIVVPTLGAAVYHAYPIVTGDAGTMYALDCQATITQFPKEEVKGKDSYWPDVYFHAHAGDTLAMTLTIKPGDTDIMRKCQLIRFVGQNGFIQEWKDASANRKAVKNPEGEKETQ